MKVMLYILRAEISSIRKARARPTLDSKQQRSGGRAEGGHASSTTQHTMESPCSKEKQILYKIIFQLTFTFFLKSYSSLKLLFVLL